MKNIGIIKRACHNGYKVMLAYLIRVYYIFGFKEDTQRCTCPCI